MATTSHVTTSPCSLVTPAAYPSVLKRGLIARPGDQRTVSADMMPFMPLDDLSDRQVDYLSLLHATIDGGEYQSSGLTQMAHATWSEPLLHEHRQQAKRTALSLAAAGLLHIDSMGKSGSKYDDEHLPFTCTPTVPAALYGGVVLRAKRHVRAYFQNLQRAKCDKGTVLDADRFSNRLSQACAASSSEGSHAVCHLDVSRTPTLPVEMWTPPNSQQSPTPTPPTTSQTDVGHLSHETLPDAPARRAALRERLGREYAERQVQFGARFDAPGAASRALRLVAAAGGSHAGGNSSSSTPVESTSTPSGRRYVDIHDNSGVTCNPRSDDRCGAPFEHEHDGIIFADYDTQESTLYDKFGTRDGYWLPLASKDDGAVSASG